MVNSICGLDCGGCGLKNDCKGCVKTSGSPFGGECVIAKCCESKGYEYCGQCDARCELKEQLISEFNALGIEDMGKVESLNALKGDFINLEYTLLNGQKIKLWNDDKIYLGNQICKKDSERCYGLTADENYLLVCEYGNGGSDAEIVIYKKRK